MIASQETKLLSINELDKKTHSELVRDVACSVFFGFYDYRKGYTERQFKKGDSLQGIYAFLENIRDSSDFMQNYQDDCSFDDIDNDLRDCEVFYWNHHPYLGLDFTNLINDFHYHLKHLGKRYNIILYTNFYKSIVPAILDEINTLCDRFIPDIDNDFYNIKEFSNKYSTAINLIYEFELIPTMPEIYKKNKRGKLVLYAKQTYEYDNNGEIVKITTTLSDKFGGNVLIRYRDTLI